MSIIFSQTCLLVFLLLLAQPLVDVFYAAVVGEKALIGRRVLAPLGLGVLAGRAWSGIRPTPGFKDHWLEFQFWFRKYCFTQKEQKYCSADRVSRNKFHFGIANRAGNSFAFCLDIVFNCIFHGLEQHFADYFTSPANNFHAMQYKSTLQTHNVCAGTITYDFSSIFPIRPRGLTDKASVS